MGKGRGGGLNITTQKNTTVLEIRVFFLYFGIWIKSTPQDHKIFVDFNHYLYKKKKKHKIGLRKGIALTREFPFTLS